MLFKSVKVVSLVFLLSSGALEAFSYARRAAEVTRTALYWAATLAVPIATGMSLYAKKHVEESIAPYQYSYLREKTPLSNAFLEKELADLGLPNTRAIPYEGENCALIHDMCINDEFLKKAEWALSGINRARRQNLDPYEQDLARIQVLKGVVHHEANHILNGDVSWRFMTAAILSSALPLVMRGAWRIAGKYLFNVEKAAAARTIRGGLLNAAIASQSIFAASRVMEQQADDRIQDRDAMEGMIMELEHYDWNLRRQYKREPALLWLEQHAGTHPSPRSRIEKLQARLKN